MNYDSPNEIRRVIESLGISLKPRWGQNFLINRGARNRFLELICPETSDTVWEIGPGLGCLTAELLPRVNSLLVFEIDWGMVRFLEQIFANERLLISQGDALKTWKAALERHGLPDKVVGNLPYRSASAIIGSFADAALAPARMVFTVQRELARRITASPGGKNYSSFSVCCQYAYVIREVFQLKPGSFYPAPEVTSSAILLEPRRHCCPAKDRQLFSRLVRDLFRSRRKTIKNNILGSSLLEEYGREKLLTAVREEGINLSARSEELQVEQFVSLANRILKLQYI